MSDTLTTAASTASSAEELLDLATSVAASAGPGEHIEVYVSRSVETDVRAFEGEVESLSSAATAGVGIRVLTAGRQGFAYAGSLDDLVVRDTLAQARDNASFATPDDHVMLAVPDGVAPARLELWDDGVVTLATSAKVDLALELERRVRAGDPRVRQVHGCDYGDMVARAAIATSTGIAATAARTLCSVSATAIAGEGAESQTGSGFSAGRGPQDLDLDKAALDAVNRATRMLGAVKGRSGSLVVVFDPRITSTLLAVVSSALSGEAVTKRRSFFAGRVGEDVARAGITLVDDPTDARAFGASSHDAEGLACRRNVLLDGGVLRGFVFDTTSANRAGTTSTASAVRGGYATTPVAGCRALHLTPGELGSEEILRAVGDGLYVQSVSGVHSGVDTISGDFSVGAEGLMIRGGELAEPVRELTVASTLQRMLHDILHVGADVEWLPGLASGQTLAIANMAASGS